MRELEGKKAFCFGDSITWYDGKVYNWGKEKGKIAVGYQSYLVRAGMILWNEGISDATILCIHNHVLMTDISDADYVFISSGANDSRYGVSIGEIRDKGAIFDITTFFGCLQSMVEYVKENSSATVVLMTPIKGWIYAPAGYEYQREADGVVEEQYAKAIMSVAQLYGVILCDWYYKSGIERNTMSRYINDPDPPENRLYSLHPSTEGYKRMADMLLSSLQNNNLEKQL